MMLFKLLRGSREIRQDSEVISLTPVGPVGDRISSLGVTVGSLNMRRGLPNPAKLLKLAFNLRKKSPDLVQCWMYHADLCGGIAAKLAGGIPVIWGIRNGLLETGSSKRSTIATARVCAALSRHLPETICCVSNAAKEFHASIGYAKEKIVVVPNGFQLDHFKPDAAARKKVREELRLSEDVLLIGLVARFDPQKDHKTFLRAAAIVLKEYQNVFFILCGDGVDNGNIVLRTWLDEFKIANRFRLLGRRDDMPMIFSSLDIAVNSSFGEGFSNAIGEAMACEVPCVVTDVGDSAEIVGSNGIIVRPRSPDELAAGIKRLLSCDASVRAEIGAAARRRVEKYFHIDVIAQKYRSIYTLIKDGSLCSGGIEDDQSC